MVMHLLADMIALIAMQSLNRVAVIVLLSVSAVLALWADGSLTWIWIGRIALGATALWLILFAFDKMMDLFTKMRREH